ncbi:MAG: hypothetical protein M1356_08790, partial [Gammaproteobacteria bacterium]|nr:hypothetical protein [Gammaproteobacteria bacterium]
DGIGGALEQIGALSSGSQVASKNADEAAHLFFGQAISKAMSIFATHPPLKDRIKRIRPNWDGKFRANPRPELQAELESEGANSAGSQQERSRQRMVETITAAATIGAAFETPASANEQELIGEARNQEGAEALVLAMALSDNDEIRAAQLQEISRQHTAQISARTAADFEKLKPFELEKRLAFVERAIPALKTLSQHEAYALLNTLHQVVEADQQTSLYEWCLTQIVTRYVRAEFEPNRRVKRVDVRRQSDAEFTLSVLAWYGHDNDNDALQAFNLGATGFGQRLQPFRQQPYSFAELGDCLERINTWSVTDKAKLVQAWITCVRSDGEINVVEQKLLLTLCACIGEPLPTLEL